MKIQNIPLDKIDQDENSRVVYKAIDTADLVHSMKKNGLLQPIGVRPTGNGRFEAVYGNRRIIAAKRLDWADIPAVVVDVDNDNDRDVLNLIENIKRVQTTPAEDGRIFQALKARGLTEGEIAARLDVPLVRVQTALEILSHVPEEYHKKIVNRVGGKKQKGKIPATIAHQILQMRKSEGLNRPQMRALLNYASEDTASVGHMIKIAPLIKKGWTVKEAIEHVQGLTRVVLDVFMNEKDIERLEKANGKRIQDVLRAKLMEEKSFKIVRFDQNPDGKYQSKLSSGWRLKKAGEMESRERA